MADNKSNNKVKNLKEHAIKKKEETKARVERTLREMAFKKEIINFNTVAEKANVSKPYLYGNSELRKWIEDLRSEQRKVKSPKSIKRNMSDESKDALIELLREKVKELESEVKKLKSQLAKKNGEIYDEI